ncbi:type II secretion system protein [Prosthecobacter vanneervenii]|uniref:Prepilin-type N-terminal cleavage/methylation domain-containing protein n=1 Tax=Prosthecobacter vanneervenii TaxID=48466 RepID=A0A7W7Y8Y1_9BACT|nr:type II secretion system protein [Prosthecobacter vanneervenii]MBB5031792.1 prepilin-type N-terminal cleavage/methylation domain-containing protein [Prosthecobacter vanneervenii]
MKITRLHSPSRNRAFTLVEMLIVVTIIALLAALTLGGYTYAMRSSKRRVTTGTFEAIKLALERYNSEFGEFPQPASTNQLAQFTPGRTMYDISGASCLYQALTGDGFDQISGAAKNAGATPGGGGGGKSDGKTEGTAEITNKMLVEIPQTIFTKKGAAYILIDGFGHPFQYLKAAPATTNTNGGGSGGSGGSNNANNATTINSTYDLWSYSEDEVNTTKQSINSLADPNISKKWIKNW